MTSGLKRERRISPMPITPTHINYIDPPWDKKENNYTLSAEQLAEVILKYGAPTAPLSSRRQPMSVQRPKPKKKTSDNNEKASVKK